MSLIIEEKDLQKFIMVGDRVLIKPKNPIGKTQSGLVITSYSIHYTKLYEN